MITQSLSQKPKISLIASDLSSRGSGRWGGATGVFLIAQTLKKLNYPVEILGLAFDSDSSTLYHPDIPIVSFPCQYYSGVVSAAKELLPRIDGDLIYAVKLKPTSFGLGIIKKLLKNRPLILNIDDWELSWYGGDDWQYQPGFSGLIKDIIKPDGALRYPDHPLYLRWLENMTSYADRITVASRFLQERFGGIYLPLGKDTELFNPSLFDPQASRNKYGLSDYRVIMFPGAPRPYKGVEDVLIALEKLNQPDLKLVIVGGSPYDDYDQKLQEKWGQWIISLPKFPVETMPEIIAAAHLIIVPQRDIATAHAQFPLKLTDGMAMAKPILATTVGDLPEILGGTGFLVNPNSPDELAAKIEEIFANLDQANHRGLQARERCIQYYSLDSMAQIMEQVLQPLIKV